MATDEKTANGLGDRGAINEPSEGRRDRRDPAAPRRERVDVRTQDRGDKSEKVDNSVIEYLGARDAPLKVRIE